MGFETYFLIALFFMMVVRFTDKEAMRVDLGSVAKFLAFMALATCARISGYDIMTQTGAPLPGMHPELIEMGVWRFMLVFWEDAFYVLPLYLIYKVEKGYYFNIKYWGQSVKQIGSRFKIPWLAKKVKTIHFQPILLAAALVLSINFALGHMYQGWGGVVVTFFYPFFISFRYGKKVGFGTVMACHILYDFITFYTVIFMPYLLP